MEEVVKSGSARRAYMPGLDICGKTSTVQNPHGYDHSGFIGFAPKEEPKITLDEFKEHRKRDPLVPGNTPVKKDKPKTKKVKQPVRGKRVATKKAKPPVNKRVNKVTPPKRKSFGLFGGNKKVVSKDE